MGQWGPTKPAVFLFTRELHSVLSDIITLIHVAAASITLLAVNSSCQPMQWGLFTVESSRLSLPVDAGALLLDAGAVKKYRMDNNSIQAR